MMYCSCMRPVRDFTLDSVTYGDSGVVLVFRSECWLCGREHKLEVEVDMAKLLRIVSGEIDINITGGVGIEES